MLLLEGLCFAACKSRRWLFASRRFLHLQSEPSLSLVFQADKTMRAARQIERASFRLESGRRDRRHVIGPIPRSASESCKPAEQQQQMWMLNRVYVGGVVGWPNDTTGNLISIQIEAQPNTRAGLCLARATMSKPQQTRKEVGFFSIRTGARDALRAASRQAVHQRRGLLNRKMCVAAQTRLD